MLEVTAAVMVWSVSFIATKLALREVLPVTVVWLRFGIGAAVLGLAILARRQVAAVPVRDLGYFALLGFLGIALHQMLQTTGLTTSQASTSAWIVSTTPVFIALLARAFLGERLGWGRSAGIGLAAAGVLVVVSRGQPGSLAAGQFGAPGDILVLAGAADWAVFSVLSRAGLSRHPAARMLFYVMAIGWLFSGLPFFGQAGPADLERLTATGWLSVGFLGVFCSGLGYIFWYDGLQVLPASQVGAFLYLEPLMAAVVASATLGEIIGPASVLGGAAILAGVWLVNRKPGF